jgi:hypothetical protein
MKELSRLAGNVVCIVTIYATFSGLVLVISKVLLILLDCFYYMK